LIGLTSPWVSEKKHELFCLFGALKKAPKSSPTDKSRPTDNTNIPKNRFSITEKNEFMVL
jgi:hypothetical protein